MFSLSDFIPGSAAGEPGLQQLKAKFDELDADGSGELDETECGAVLQALNPEKTVSKGTLSNMVRLADVDGSGTISFDEFAAIIKAI